MAPSFTNQPVDCDIDFDPSNLVGKTAIVTGGASGLGEAYVRALVKARAHVCFGDLNEENGQKLASELSGTEFVQCDVTQWEDQVRLFRTAASRSPSGRVDYVVANAGISSKDEVFTYDGDDKEPTKPSLKILNVNLESVMYTAKLAFHYFIKQNGTTPSPSQQDTCLVLIGSGAAFLDVPRTPQYCAAKWGMRGMMHALRRTAFYYGSRVNVISPWFVKTNILPEETFEKTLEMGVEFATVEDAGQCLLRILSDREVNGRSLFLAPRKWAKRGYLDLDSDPFLEEGLLGEIQREQIRPAAVELGLFVDEKGR
ncbi:AdhA [Stagonosporopsis vannaccii]|nr:AdhA [Stagonosporopsis vannaccii]